MQQRLIILTCLLLCGFGALAQFSASGTVTGTTGIALGGAHLHIGSRQIAADATGHYTVSGLAAGKVKFHVSYIGYQPIDTTVVVSGDIVLDFKLRVSVSALEEVAIQQPAGSRGTVREARIKTETIEKYSSQSLGDALKEVAGVSSLKTGSTVVKPIINGLYGSRVPVISNNVRLEDQQWGTEHAPNFDVNAAGKITVIKGASGLQYGGDAVGGLVLLEPLSVKKDTLMGKTIVDFSSNGRGGSISSGLHKGNVEGWSWNALGTFKYFGDREAPDYVLSNTGNREANFSGDVNYTTSRYEASVFYSYYRAQIGILSASHTGNVNDLYRSINGKVPSVIDDFTYDIGNPKQKVAHHLLKTAFNYHLSDNADLSAQYAFQFNNRQEFDVRRGNYSNLAALDLDLETHSAQIDYKNLLGDWTLKTGASGAYQSNFADPATRVRPLIPTYKKYDAGVYGIASWAVSPSLVLESGVRYDFSKIDAVKFYQVSRWEERGYDADFADIIYGEQSSQYLTKPSFTYHNVSASLGFRKQFHHEWDWYANASLASRNPNPSELFSDGLHHATGVIELGDLRLKQERAFKISTSVGKRWQRLSIDFNPYLNIIQDYMFLQPVGFETTIRGAFPVWEYRQTNARLAGVDFQSKFQATKHWRHELSLAYVNGRDVSGSADLIDMPPLNIGNKIQFAKEEWNRLLLELKSEWVTHQSQYPRNNFETNIVVDGVQVPVIVDISTPPPAYHLLHFYSEVKFKTLGAQTTLAFAVQNILDTRYRDYLNRQRFYADETGRNFQIQLKFNY
ncbi:TonB-dependent receptor [Flavobacterium caeni]|uniref:Iron complex outermembrane recepter protein n=1 Tax=Flavobacterium caeni TaxID=490189 RepID=A0A1G5H8J0_9FLAO|nr:TonB-dependent receptor [Flavobacterium caeni]SCY60205.1 iron complex outermembrane recepter protein [Flavobacterium caeni]